MTGEIHLAKRILRLCEAGIGRLTHPPERLGIVACDAPSGPIE
ncbi:MAG: hypothetical protein WBP94_11585 [Rhodomicrobiaceae bacterium]